MLTLTCFDGASVLSIRIVRRLFSILLLVLFGLPFVSPLFALSTNSDAGLRACCRRNGVHHCTGMAEERVESDGRQGLRFAAPIEKCPYFPAAVVVLHPTLFVPAMSSAIFAGLVSHPSGVAQIESKLRISLDRSRQKRGPPAISSL